jgi:hypothetical protein
MPITSQAVGQWLRQSHIVKEESTEARIADAYELIRAERIAQGEEKLISVRDLARYAKVRRATCSSWLERHVTEQGGQDE